MRCWPDLPYVYCSELFMAGLWLCGDIDALIASNSAVNFTAILSLRQDCNHQMPEHT